MKKVLSICLAFFMFFSVFSLPIMAAEETYLFLVGENFKEDLGTWGLEAEADAFMSKLLRSTITTQKPELSTPATTVVEFPSGGEYYVWVSSKDFESIPGSRFANIEIGGKFLDKKIGVHEPGYAWELIGTVKMPKGNGLIRLLDTSGHYCRIDAILLTTDKNYTPTRDKMDADYKAHKVDPSKVLTANVIAEGGTPIVVPTATPLPTPTPTPRPTPVPKPKVEFSDVTEAFSWAIDAIYILAEREVVKGTGEGRFTPEADITRAEFVTLINGITKTADKQYTNAFSDVQSGQWFAQKVQAAYDAELIDEALIKDGAFLPDQPITREEMTSFIVKAYETISGQKAAGSQESAFADSGDISDWAKGYVNEAVRLDVIKGVGDNRFAPKDKANRAQSAVMIYRILNATKGGGSVTVIADGAETAALSIKEALELAKGKESTIVLGGGKHYIDETLIIDSSFGNKNLTIKAAPGEKPVLTAGVEVTGWEQESGSIYRAKVDGVNDFRQLYINEERAIRARFPNESEFFKFPRTYDANGFIVKTEALAKLDLSAGIGKYKDSLELSTTMTWMNKRLRVTDIAISGDTATLKINPIEWKALTTGAQGAKEFGSKPYWLENAYEFIDQPYEWFFDKDSGYVYLYAPEGMDLNMVTVTVPKLERIISIEGTQNETVENITIDGIEFSYTGWVRPNDYGFVDVQANSILPIPQNDKNDTRFRHNQKKDKLEGAIYANYANNIEIINSVFSHLGGNGITFDLGGQNVRMEGNALYDISGNGIEIGSDSNKPDSESMKTKNVTIKNNYVYDVSKEYQGGIGILVMFCDTAEVSNNHVKKVPYSGINISWGWDGQGYATYTKDFTIKNNLVEEYAQVTNDTGGIYSPNHSYGTNVMEGNYIKGDYLSMTDNMIMGIYHDSMPSNWINTNNVVENVRRWMITGKASGALDKDIKFINSYINVPDKGKGTLRTQQLTFENTVEVSDYNWGSEARAIMDNAGLLEHYKSLREMPKGMLEITMLPTVIRATAGEEIEYSFEVVNRLGRDVSIAYSPKDENQVLTDISGEIHLKSGERKIITEKTVVSNEVNRRNNKEIIQFTYNGRTVEKSLGVMLPSVTLGGSLIILDYEDPTFKKLAGEWSGSGVPGYDGLQTMYGYWTGASCMWAPQLSGKYEVSFFNPYHPNTSKKVTLEVVHKDGIEVLEIDQTAATKQQGDFIVLGTFEFTGSPEEGLRATNLSEDAQNGFLRISCVRFLLQE